jgi:hypothetical protein
MSPDSPAPATKVIDAAILIAVASALAYAVSMSFECGYASFFGVPAKLIEANPKNILVCAATVFFAVPGGLYMWDMLGMFWPRSWAPAMRRAIGALLLLPFFGLVFYFFFDINLIGLAIIIAPWFTFLLFSELLIPLIAHREKPTFVAKLEAEQDRSAREISKSPPIIRSLMNRFGPRPFAYAFFTMTACALAFGFGYRDARTEKSFLIASGKGAPCVFVTSYLDSLICAGIDVSAKKLTGQLRFVHIHDLEFTLQTVGVLVPADSNIWAPIRRAPAAAKSASADKPNIEKATPTPKAADNPPKSEAAPQVK